MSLTSFSKPSDEDILKAVTHNGEEISFVGKGSVNQNVNETIYIRLIKITLDKEEVLKKVIYTKKGISWLLKNIENITISNKSAVIKEN